MLYQKKVLVVLIMISLTACGSNETVIEKKEEKVKIKNILSSGDQLKGKTDEHAKKRADRKKRGDTLVINYKELQKYLPDIEGFSKVKEPKGETVNMGGIGSWSKTEQKYEGAGGKIEVELSDYVQSSEGFSIAAAAFSLNIQVENDREKSGTFDTGIKDVQAYETLFKKTGRITQLYAISDRFFLRLEGKNGVTSEQLKAIAKKMPMDELVSK